MVTTSGSCWKTLNLGDMPRKARKRRKAMLICESQKSESSTIDEIVLCRYVLFANQGGGKTRFLTKAERKKALHKDPGALVLKLKHPVIRFSYTAPEK